MTLHPKFITANNGNKDAVILPINEYNRLLEELEDMEDIRLYDEAKAANEPSIPIDEAFKILDARRKKK
jgi:hypothetical protein